LQWAAGGLLFLWFTSRSREVGLGYGWLLRGTNALLAAGAVFCGFRFGVVPVREAASIAVAVASTGALVVSIVRRRAGVSGQTADHDRRTDRIAEMTGIEREVAEHGVGHWYLVQPGLPRRHLNELVNVLGWIWPVETVAMLLPTGMFSVFSGSIDDGWHGQLGWFWAACTVTTIVLVVVTKAALKERAYSAVMAATGLLYLAILTAFGTDLVARAVLAG
jgi:hypothetical protein